MGRIVIVGHVCAVLLAIFAATAICATQESENDWQETEKPSWSEVEELVTPEQQYTPDQADYSTFQTKPLAVSSITAHDPDSVGWIPSSTWKRSEWDGTVYNPLKMTTAAFNAAICPSVDTIRGIRELFYRHRPFADNKNPTKAEIDEWHRIAINHVRALVGYTGKARQVSKDHCMFARALWGDERRFTTNWDSKYPGKVGSAAGPCHGSNNAHCGATFLPNAQDQKPYLPAGYPACTLTAGAEGVFSGPKSNIPWSIKWSRALCNTLLAEGFWGGHTGPFFLREKFGFSFWDTAPSNNNNNAILRAKWTGKLMDHLYCNPKEAGCGDDERPKCWMRMPTGCSRRMGETRRPKEYFVWPRANNEASCKSVLGRFNGWCRRNDATQSFGMKPDAEE